MRHSIPILLAVLAVSPLSAAAAPRAPPQTTASPRVDPAAVAAANRLLDAMNYDQLVDRTMNAMIAEAERTVPQKLEAVSGTALPADLKAKLTTVISDFMRRLATANRAEMRQGTALIYARHFTASEINHMIELQRDPVLVKMQVELPQIMTESMALSQASLEQETPRMMEQLKAVIEEYERNKGEKPAT